MGIICPNMSVHCIHVSLAVSVIRLLSLLQDPPSLSAETSLWQDSTQQTKNPVGSHLPLQQRLLSLSPIIVQCPAAVAFAVRHSHLVTKAVECWPSYLMVILHHEATRLLSAVVSQHYLLFTFPPLLPYTQTHTHTHTHTHSDMGFIVDRGTLQRLQASSTLFTLFHHPPFSSLQLM